MKKGTVGLGHCTIYWRRTTGKSTLQVIKHCFICRIETAKQDANIQCISRGDNRSKCELFSCENKKQGVMVWMGISTNGVTRPKFVKSGAKINWIYYQNKILKPFLRNDIPRLYPDSCFVLDQDSALVILLNQQLSF